MQIGQTIWAIDPCKIKLDSREALIVGKKYTVESFDEDDNSFEIKSEVAFLHRFMLKNFNKYFSLTPPEGKGGVKESIIAQIEKSISELTQLRDHLTEVLNKE